MAPQSRAAAYAVGLAAILGVTACSRGEHAVETRMGSSRASPSIDPRTGTSASPRVASDGDVIPKGGGTFKLGSPYKIAGRWYVPREDHGYDATGVASWYGTDFHGRKTANGEIYDMNALTAAHTTLPLPSYAYVTNLENGRTVLVRINDRGPYAHDRIIDLSRHVARALGSESRGLTSVRVRYAGRAPLNGDDSRERQHLASQNWWRGGGEAIATPMHREPIVPQQADNAGWSPFSHRSAGRSGLGGR